MRSFDRVAARYALLERLAFGSTLARTRNALLGELRGATRVLILGEGDGRFLEGLLRVNSRCQVDCVDKSRKMVTLAERRVSSSSQRARVTFHQRDALTFTPPAAHYDLIVTLFFLDVLTEDQLGPLIQTLARSLEAGGRWYVADFRVPSGPLRRLHSLVWLRLLYSFFGWQTDMEARTLADPTRHLSNYGLVPVKTRYRRLGMLYSQLLQKSPS